MKTPIQSREIAMLIEEMRARLHQRHRERESTAEMCSVFGFILVLVLLLALTGCSGPKQFAAPPSKLLTEGHKEVAARITEARTHVKRASGNLDSAKTHHNSATVSHSKETVLLGELAPRLLALRTQSTDAVLREEVDVLSESVKDTRALAVITDAELAAIGRDMDRARDDLGGATAALALANRKATDLEETIGPDYVTATEKTIADANGVIMATSAKVDREAKAKWIWFSAFTLTAAGFAAFVFLKR